MLSLIFLTHTPAYSFFLDDWNEAGWQIIFSLPDNQAGKPKQNRPRQNNPRQNNQKPDNQYYHGGPEGHERLIPIEQDNPEDERKKEFSFGDIAGHDDLIQKLRSTIKQMENPELLRKLGGKPKKGILLEGPSGTGKTLIAKAIAHELGYEFHSVSASSMIEVYVGTGAQRVREVFTKAKQTAPSVIFLDEVDAIAAASRKESSSGGDQEYRQTLTELLNQMNDLDKLPSDQRVIVIAATNTIEAIDPAFKAPHRFDVLSVPLPDYKGRQDILDLYLNKLQYKDLTVDKEKHPEVDQENLVNYLASRTVGFSGAQLESIINGAVHKALMEEDASLVTASHILYSLEDERKALRSSSFGAQYMENDKVSFSDIAGMPETVEEFQDLVYSLKNPDVLRNYGVTLPRGILLEGKPGCGKTMLVQALANATDCSFYYASGSSFDGKYMGEGSKNIKELFSKAKMVSPSIIFIDEIDAINTAGTLNELLTQMDGFHKETNIIVIGATNVIKEVDYRLRRPGRFDRIIKVDLPNKEGRLKILELYTNKLPNIDTKNIPYEDLALHTEGFSGAALKTMVNDAATLACKAQAEQVGEEHFRLALQRALKNKGARRA